MALGWRNLDLTTQEEQPGWPGSGCWVLKLQWRSKIQVLSKTPGTMQTHQRQKARKKETETHTGWVTLHTNQKIALVRDFPISPAPKRSTFYFIYAHLVLGFQVCFPTEWLSLTHTHSRTQAHTDNGDPREGKGKGEARNPGHALIVTLSTQGHLICSQSRCLLPHSAVSLSREES